MKSVLENQPNLHIRQTVVDEILLKCGTDPGIRTSLDEEIEVRAVVVATGTFLNGLIHVGLKNFPPAAWATSRPPAWPWFKSCRLCRVGQDENRDGPPRSTATPSISANLEPSTATTRPTCSPFPAPGRQPLLPQRPCHITYTNPEQTHRDHPRRN
jgi:tRNA uridine 5-carboxymethylaminomethyl modification enzyme